MASGDDSPASPAGAVLVIGVGNTARGDDGVGPAVVSHLRDLAAPVDTVIREGDLIDLCLLWTTDTAVIIIDACWTGVRPGTCRLLDPATLGAGPLLSSHGLGVAEAVKLAEHLGRRPRSLQLLGVEAATVDHGPMSGVVAGRLDAVARQVIRLAAGAAQSQRHLPRR